MLLVGRSLRCGPVHVFPIVDDLRLIPELGHVGLHPASSRRLQCLFAHRLNACGYSLGTTYAPNWMDFPMLYGGQAMPARPGMVLFIHIIAFDAANGLAMTLGRTSLVTEGDAEQLSAASIELVRR